MRRPFPRLDKSRPFGVVTPPYEGACFEQAGYHFDNDGRVVEDLLDDQQRERHFGEGVADDRTLLGSAKFDEASYDIIEGVAAVENGDLIAQAHDASGLTIDEWNGLDDDGRADHMERQLANMRAIMKPKAKKAPSQTVGKAADPAPEKKVKVDPEVRAAPLAPPPAPPPAPTVELGKVDPSKINLKAWYDGGDDTVFASQEIIAAIYQQFGVKVRGGYKAARSWLEDEKGYGPKK